MMTQAAAGAQDLRLLAVPGSSIADQGHLLLVLTGRDRQCAAELAAASGQNLTDTVHALGRLVDQGFLLMDDENGTSGYRLGPRRDRPVTADCRARILLVEDDLLIRDLLVDVLEAEGYGIVACEHRARPHCCSNKPASNWSSRTASALYQGVSSRARLTWSDPRT